MGKSFWYSSFQAQVNDGALLHSYAGGFGINTASGTWGRGKGLLLDLFGSCSSKLLVNLSGSSGSELGSSHNASFLHSNSSFESSHASLVGLASLSADSSYASSVSKFSLFLLQSHLFSFLQFNLSSKSLDQYEVLSVLSFLLRSNNFVSSPKNFISSELVRPFEILLVAYGESLLQLLEVGP
jgi:hypothetical protein